MATPPREKQLRPRCSRGDEKTRELGSCASVDDVGREPSCPRGVIRGGAAANPSLDEIAPHGEDRDRRLVGATVAGRYRIARLLGTGGMGTVYLAEHVPMRKPVAVKVLHRELGYLPEVVARFEREAVAAGRIEHPHVAAATDFGRLDDGSLYLVLEYVEGSSLAQTIAASGPLPAERALRIARQVADALCTAHRLGIVHRDLKPENIMLVEREGVHDFVKVLDFGIAKVTLDPGNPHPLTQQGTIFGTPEYMAPEQAAGTIVDHRADLYTLGVVLYEMLAGQTPFSNDDLLAVLTAQMTEPPPALPPTVDAKVASLVAGLLAKDPDHRYPTAEEVVRQIDLLLGVTRGHAEQGLESRRVAPTKPDSQMSDEGESQNRRARARLRNLPRAPWARSASLRFGSLEFPAWSLVAAASLVLGSLLAAAVVALQPGRAADEDRRALGLATATARPAADLERLGRLALAGDRGALAQLERVPHKSREQWFSVAHGNLVGGRVGESMASYARALDDHPELAADERVKRDLRILADHPQTADAALDTALRSLGATGPDLVYDVWYEAKADPARSGMAQRAQALLDSPRVRAQASGPLLVAWDLWNGTTCTSYRNLLPRAIQQGDRRSAPVLRSLAKTDGCGLFKLKDCYHCLRDSDRLATAIAATQARPAPSFR